MTPTLLLSLALGAWPAPADVEPLYPDLEKLYVELHQNPELSLQEEKTAARLAARLEALGFKVTPRVGGHGVVGILENGSGPTVLLRADMDGLPIEEQTGLPFASKVKAVDKGGATVSVMHACGHDVHMTTWMGAATLLSRNKEKWRGTLMMVAQPAEEIGSGARAMLAAGLYKRWKKPDYALAFHVNPEIPSGRIEHVAGWALANVDAIDLTLFGRGGHGARPHETVDPVVLAARVVLALQTLVSREKDPGEPGVITVGSIHGGTKSNIIPDRVKLQITVRSYKDEVRKALLDGIARIAKAESVAARSPKEPLIEVTDGTPATYNDPTLTQRMAAVLGKVIGDRNVGPYRPIMGGEDFGEFGRAGVPATIFWLGVGEPRAVAKAKASGQPLPSIHSPFMAPDRGPAIRTGVVAMTGMVAELLRAP
jgi:hippurate hydrolase